KRLRLGFASTHPEADGTTAHHRACGGPGITDSSAHAERHGAHRFGAELFAARGTHSRHARVGDIQLHARYVDLDRVGVIVEDLQPNAVLVKDHALIDRRKLPREPANRISVLVPTEWPGSERNRRQGLGLPMPARVIRRVERGDGELKMLAVFG